MTIHMYNVDRLADDLEHVMVSLCYVNINLEQLFKLAVNGYAGRIPDITNLNREMAHEDPDMRDNVRGEIEYLLDTQLKPLLLKTIVDLRKVNNVIYGNNKALYVTTAD